VAVTCKAVVSSRKQTWEIREFLVPGPPSGGAILRVEAVGMCHSDVDMSNGLLTLGMRYSRRFPATKQSGESTR
jgi:D-arabinose 1-dehydrogenase-like Zn-dependent alcohol dehydrogenase